eukprot:CAMPEP_0184670528 /NCGR_PEP_ID=MMETSP0308-20130426/82581_1 /TAXON_ID=38269 /ORGANISM="Gloeochaete witrockiana, Strain SAG 46.84" /LENGTH=235 /DNA_ID=CAMNT_0027117297 /DNA_START=51 /DNA_END=758 /DNA_ORIENTATION=+
MTFFHSRGYIVYAFSLRGHGKSQGTVKGTRLKDYVEDLAKIVEKVTVTHGVHPILVGHSSGGTIALKYMENVKTPAACFLSLGSGSSVMTVVRYMMRHPYIFFKCHFTFSTYATVSTPELAKEALFSKDIPMENLMEYFSQLGDESYTFMLDQALGRDVPDESTVAKTQEDVPLLVLGAEDDACFTAKEVTMLATELKVQAQFVKGVAHDMMLDVRWEDSAKKVLEFLEMLRTKL